MGGRGEYSGGNGSGEAPENPADWTLDQLQNYIRQNPETNTLQKTQQWLQAHQSTDTITLQDDVMTAPEIFHTVLTIDGIELLFVPGNEAKAAAALGGLLNGYPYLPEVLQHCITRIIMSTQEITEPFTIGATAGTADNNIVFYNQPVNTQYLAHEASHNLALKLWKSPHPPHYAEGTDAYFARLEQGLTVQSDYGAAIESGEPPVSDYASTNDAEDFSEAVELYVMDPAQLQQIAPRRYAVIHRLMIDPMYGG